MAQAIWSRPSSPPLVGSEGVDLGRKVLGFLPQILLKYYAIVIDHERHDTGVAILRWVGDERESADHPTIHHIVECATFGVRALALEDAVIVTMKRDRRVAELVTLV